MAQHKFKTYREMADFLRKIQTVQVPKTIQGILTIVGEAAVEEVKEHIIGRIRPLGAVDKFNAWEPLKQATIDRKEKKGLGMDGDGRTMLYESGDLYNSIGMKVNKIEKNVAVGTDNPYAAAHEYGGGNAPPRPFLGPGMYIASHRLYNKLETIWCKTLSGDRPF